MDILLLSTNHTVQNIIESAISSIDGVSLETYDDPTKVHSGNFKIAIVDNTIPLLSEAISLTKHLGVKKTILLTHPHEVHTEKFDKIINKPFLPEEITALVKKYKVKIEKKEGHKNNDEETEVLNLQEIETIKALLEEDGLEVVHEEELADTVLSESETNSRINKKMSKKLLKAITKTKPKKILKLLKGAKVTIHIEFPQENR